MLLVIHNLPGDIRYSDLKTLLQAKCGISDVILDNLLNEGKYKKVTVGLADEGDAAMLVRKINGLFIGDQQLYVEDVRKNKATEQPYRSSHSILKESSRSDFQFRGKDSFQQQHNALQTEDDYENRDGHVPRDSFDQRNKFQERKSYQQRDSYQQRESHQQPDNFQHRDNFQQRDDFQQRDNFEQRDNFQQRDNINNYNPHDSFNQKHINFNKSQQMSYQGNTEMFQDNQMRINHDPVPMTTNYNMAMGGIYRMPAVPVQAPIIDYTGQSQQIEPSISQMSKTRNYTNKGESTKNINRRERPDWTINNSRSDRPRQISPNRDRRPDEVERQSRWDISDIKYANERSPQRYSQKNQFTENEYHGYQNPKNIRQHDHNERMPARSNPQVKQSFESSLGSGAVERSPNKFETQNYRSPSQPWNNKSNFERNQETGNPFQPRNDVTKYQRKEVPKAFDDRKQSPRGNFNFSQPTDRKVVSKAFELRNDRRESRGDSNFSPSNVNRDAKRPWVAWKEDSTSAVPVKRSPVWQTNRDEPQPKKFAGPKPHPNQNIPKSFPGHRNNVPTQIAPKPKEFKPAAFRAPNSGFKTGRTYIPPTQTNKPPKPKPNMAAILRKDTTWRQQAAARLAKELLESLKIVDIENSNEIVRQLKTHIKSRIEVMLGPELAVPITDIVFRYRKRYPPANNKSFFVSVLNKIKEATADNADKGPSVAKADGAETKDDNAANMDKQKEPELKKEQKKPVSALVPAQERPGPVMPPVSVQTTDTIPKLAKKYRAQQKNLGKEEIENPDMYTLPEKLRTALDEQSDVLCDLFMGACEPDKETDRPICERISDQIADEFRKIMRLNLTKRLLKINTLLLVRVYPFGKVDRLALDAFLRRYGVTNMKKSDRSRMFIATCDTIENFDALCALKSASINGVDVSLKPLNLTGPPKQITRMQILQERQKIIDLQIDNSDENLLAPKSSQTSNAESKGIADKIIPSEESEVIDDGINMEDYDMDESDEAEIENAAVDLDNVQEDDLEDY